MARKQLGANTSNASDAVNTSGAQTLTNKTIAAGSNTITGLGVAALGGITGTADSTTFLRGDGQWATPSGSGDASTNTATSVDGEVVLFNGTSGKSLRRANQNGIAKLTSGVLSTVTAPSGAIVGDSDAQTLTSKTLTSPKINTIKDTNGNTAIDIGVASSAVNYVKLSNAATGASPVIAADGSDPNLGLYLRGKGTGRISLTDGTDTTKVALLDMSGISTGTNRAFAFPDSGGNIVVDSATQTLTGKTLTTPTIGDFTNATHGHTNAAGGGQLNLTTASNATGTPSATTYLRGDNTWATIPAISLTGSPVTTTGASNAGKYIPLFQVGFGAQGDTYTLYYNVTTSVDSATAQLAFYGKQTAAMNNDPTVTMSMLSNNSSNIDISQFTAVVTTKNIAQTIITVYGQVNRANEIWGVHYMGYDTTGSAAGAALTGQSYVAALPGGTQFTTSYVNTSVATPTSSAHAVTKSYADSVNTTGSAAKLTTSRTIRTDLTSTSTASFDGTANITPGVTGNLPITNGGTGVATLPTGILKGAGTGAITAVTAPTGAIVGDTDTQTLSAKTLTSPKINLIKDTNGNTAISINPVGSAVNDLIISNAAAATYPYIAAEGTDTDIGIDLSPKGTSSVRLYGRTGQTVMRLKAGGSATDVDLDLASKGAGVVTINSFGVAKKYTATIGDGVTTSIAVTHNLGTQDITYSIRDASTNAFVDCDVVATSTTVATFSFAIGSPPATNAYKVVIIG